MKIEQEVLRLRDGDLIEENREYIYFIRASRTEIKLSNEEAELTRLIQQRISIEEIAQRYCLKNSHLIFKNFVFTLNRIASKGLLFQPKDFSQSLAQYLKKGFNSSTANARGCYVTQRNQALKFSPEELKDNGSALLHLKEIIKDIPLFEDISPEEALVFFKHGRIRRFSPGEVIIDQNDSSFEFYLLLKGVVEVFNEKNSSIAELFAGSVFGESPYIFDLKRTASVRVKEPSLVIELGRSALRNVESDLAQLHRLESGSKESTDTLSMIKKKFIINRIQRDQKLFKGVHASLIEAFFRKGNVVKFAKDQKVFAQNSRGKDFYVVASGQVSIVRDGRVVAELIGGDYFGEISLFRDVPRTADVIAKTDCSFIRLLRKDFFSVLCQNLNLALLIESNIEERMKTSPDELQKKTESETGVIV